MNMKELISQIDKIDNMKDMNNVIASLKIRRAFLKNELARKAKATFKVGDKVKTIRFGEQGAKTAGKPKKGESDRMKKKRASFKARHRKNIARGKLSAAYWANKVKW